ncbi:hypothetical protein C2S52_016448 [Perilla frutescens var. hirtella]|nr:hypothetical protein C2S52_016448 [Perilla frutescens var. hirtella]
MGFVKRVIELGLKSVSELRTANAAASPKSYRSFSSNSSTTNRLKDELISPLLHNLPAVRKLEALGIPSEHVRAITSAMTQALDEKYNPIVQNLVTNSEMQNILKALEANSRELKFELQGYQEELHQLQLEVEKLQKNSEIMRCKITNAAAPPHPDLNLEREKQQNKVKELIHRHDESISLTTNFKQEIHASWANPNWIKQDVSYKYTKILCVSAVGISFVSLIKAYFDLVGHV